MSSTSETWPGLLGRTRASSTRSTRTSWTRSAEDRRRPRPGEAGRTTPTSLRLAAGGLAWEGLAWAPRAEEGEGTAAGTKAGRSTRPTSTWASSPGACGSPTCDPCSRPTVPSSRQGSSPTGTRASLVGLGLSSLQTRRPPRPRSRTWTASRSRTEGSRFGLRAPRAMGRGAGLPCRLRAVPSSCRLGRPCTVAPPLDQGWEWECRWGWGWGGPRRRGTIRALRGTTLPSKGWEWGWGCRGISGKGTQQTLGAWGDRLLLLRHRLLRLRRRRTPLPHLLPLPRRHSPRRRHRRSSRLRQARRRQWRTSMPSSWQMWGDESEEEGC
mmetsp:Transcript_9698/g.33507  ORF Transcript_9698/g.33507 Transcript_9698/m.33507 type:complete len:325 (+) Transcript_9698:951-1925(+)